MAELNGTVTKAVAYKDGIAPLGFLVVLKKTSVKKPLSGDDLEQLKQKKAWELATGPVKSVFMNAVMGYMTGNSLQIIPISMTFMMLLSPLKAIFTETNRTFDNLDLEDKSYLLLVKVVFIVCQLLNMSIGVYKLYKMGLIPHASADWLLWMEPLSFKEKVYIL